MKLKTTKKFTKTKKQEKKLEIQRKRIPLKNIIFDKLILNDEIKINKTYTKRPRSKRRKKKQRLKLKYQQPRGPSCNFFEEYIRREKKAHDAKLDHHQ